jgi:anaerobic dimethyl sulfoxide reductase subunit B (iron-sulfur subunit)
MPQYGWHIHLDNCIACRACEAACKQEFALPAGVRRRLVVVQEGTANGKPFMRHVTMACMHCATPACMSACPVNRYWKDTDAVPEFAALRKAFGMDQNPDTGLVLIKPSVAEDPVNGVDCIGCKRCAAACPYGACKWDDAHDQMDKCVGCYHRLFNTNLPPERRKPACAVTCSAIALHFDELSLVEGGKYGQADKNTSAPNGIPEIADVSITSPSVRFAPQKNIG